MTRSPRSCRGDRLHIRGHVVEYVIESSAFVAYVRFFVANMKTMAVREISLPLRPLARGEQNHIGVTLRSKLVEEVVEQLPEDRDSRLPIPLHCFSPGLSIPSVWSGA